VQGRPAPGVDAPRRFRTAV
jgi:hypothetical protein